MSGDKKSVEERLDKIDHRVSCLEGSHEYELRMTVWFAPMYVVVCKYCGKRMPPESLGLVAPSVEVKKVGKK